MGPWVSAEEWQILRRSTVMASPATPAPLLREQALQLFDELDRLKAERERIAQLADELAALVGRSTSEGRRLRE